MTIITITRNAKCKDCKFCNSYRKGKLRRHKCINTKSEYYNQDVRLNDLVCDKWEL